MVTRSSQELESGYLEQASDWPACVPDDNLNALIEKFHHTASGGDLSQYQSLRREEVTSVAAAVQQSVSQYNTAAAQEIKVLAFSECHYDNVPVDRYA